MRQSALVNCNMFLPFSIRNAILALLFVCQLIFWSANAQESDKHFDRDLNEVDDDQRGKGSKAY